MKKAAIIFLFLMMTFQIRAEFTLSVSVRFIREGYDNRNWFNWKLNFMNGKELEKKTGKTNYEWGRIYAVFKDESGKIIIFGIDNTYLSYPFPETLSYERFTSETLNKAYLKCTVMNNLNYISAGEKAEICLAEYCE